MNAYPHSVHSPSFNFSLRHAACTVSLPDSSLTLKYAGYKISFTAMNRFIFAFHSELSTQN
jgi:hypothetical protein